MDLIKSSLKQIQNSNFKEEDNLYIVTEWFALLQILPNLKQLKCINLRYLIVIMQKIL